MLISSFLTSSKPRKTHPEEGFTLIEVLIVISIISVLTTIMLGYSRSSSQQILLTSLVTKTEVLISNARFSSVQTFFNDPDSIICAHGVRFDADGLRADIFQLTMATTDCPEDAGEYSNEPDSGFDVVYLTGSANQLDYKSNQTTTALDGDFSIIFVPPNPEIVINNDPDIPSGTLTVTVGDMQAKITVTKYGQIDFTYL